MANGVKEQKYVDTIEQNALAVAWTTIIVGGSMVHRLDFDLGLDWLAAAADGGGSGDQFSVRRLGQWWCVTKQ